MIRISVIAVWFLSVSVVWAQNETGVLPDSDVEPLLRGPVHEAFAEPIQLNPEEMLTVPKSPPPLVEEVPPDARPAGEGVNWIPGYWAWDDEREDFIWVSGIYRRTPSGRSWQAGQWEEVADGYRWLPGRWISTTGVGELLPTPPESLEEGPQGEPISEDHFWVPGSWQHRNQRYVWRPGFWSACHDNWVWVPDYYVAGINGCHFVPGYWDYGWEHRGTIFAPCRFRRSHVGFRYCPSVVIDFAGAFTHLWVRPQYCHYYFGDYYDNRYGSWGIQPWYRYHHHHRRAYDPLYVHYKWRYRHHHGIGLHKHLHNRHVHYRDGKHRRPDRKYRDYAARGKHHDTDVLAHRVKDHRLVEERRKKTRRDVLQVRTEAQKHRLRDRPEGQVDDVRRATAENRRAGNRRTGSRTAENRTAENRTAENLAAENRTAENRTAENLAAENRTAGNRAAGNRRAQNRTEVGRNDVDRRNSGRQVAREKGGGREAEGRSRNRSMAEVIRDARNQQASTESPAGNQPKVTENPVNPLRNQVVRERTAASQGRVQPVDRSSRQTDSAANRSSRTANRNAQNSGRARATDSRQNGSSSATNAGKTLPAESVTSKPQQRTRTRSDVKPATQAPTNRLSKESPKSSPRARFESRTGQTRNRVITAKPVTQPRSDKPTSRANNPSASRSQTSPSPVAQSTSPRTSINRSSSSRASSPRTSNNRSSSSRGGSPRSKINRSSSSRASSPRSSINRSSSSRASSPRSSINRSSSSRGSSPRSSSIRSSGSRGGKSRP